LRGVFLPPDHYAVILTVTGEWGDIETSESLSGAPGAFHASLKGVFVPLVDLARGFQGPVALTRLAAEPGGLKATVVFLENRTPAAVSLTTMCRGGELALIHVLKNPAR
jgi:hypothetical protein